MDVARPRQLASKYVRCHAVREVDVGAKAKGSGSGSYKRWLPSAMLRASHPGMGRQSEILAAKVYSYYISIRNL